MPENFARHAALFNLAVLLLLSLSRALRVPRVHVFRECTEISFRDGRARRRRCGAGSRLRRSNTVIEIEE